MSTTTMPKTQSAVLPPVPVYRFTVEQYHRMGQAGILTEDDRVELLEGWIVPKMTHNPPHDTAIEFVDAALRPLLPAGWRLRIQSVVSTLESEPEPDIAVVRGAVGAHATRHPGPDDVGLIIEVAEASLRRDREVKQRVYARAGIPHYWIVNVVEGQVEVYSHAAGPADEPRYRQQKIVQAGETVLLILDGKSIAEIPVADLFP